MDIGKAFDFRRRRALVTGGSRGIGAAISKALAACGAEVVINFRSDGESAERTVSEIIAAGGSCRSVRANLVHPEEVRALIEATGPSLDFLIHNAALGSFKPTMELRANQWDLSMNVNARALLLAAQAASSRMQAGGRIIAISSLGSRRAVPQYGAIGISKAALEAVVRYLSTELGERGINVNAVSGGVIGGSSIAAHPQYAELLPALSRGGRPGEPGDIASAVLFLCSGLAGWINGEVLVVDGGMSARL
jgi:enoyl-[acyl-carrier protein] reductase III